MCSFLFQKVSSLNGQVESAAISSAKKADLKAKISILQVRKTQSVEKLVRFFLYLCLSKSKKIKMGWVVFTESSDKK